MRTTKDAKIHEINNLKPQNTRITQKCLAAGADKIRKVLWYI